LFEKRIFKAYITKVSNVYYNSIADYKTGVGAMIESSKINEGIFNFENDLWYNLNY